MIYAMPFNLCRPRLASRLDITEEKRDNWKELRIHMAHPISVIKFEGTKKHCNTTMGSYILNVWDHMDAWTFDG